jgi:hypothetical protein
MSSARNGLLNSPAFAVGKNQNSWNPSFRCHFTQIHSSHNTAVSSRGKTHGMKSNKEVLRNLLGTDDPNRRSSWFSLVPLTNGKTLFWNWPLPFLAAVFRFTVHKLKVKVKLFLCFFNWAQRHEGVLGGAAVELHAFLNSALDGGKWSALRPGRFTSRERAPGTHWIWSWVGPRASLDAVVKRKNSQPLPGLEPLIMQPVAQRYTTELSQLLFVSFGIK